MEEWRMRTRVSAVLNLAGIISIAVALTVTASAHKPDGADEQAIKDVVAATTQAFNAHDAAAFARFYTADAELVTVRGEQMRGAAEIEKGLARIFATRAGGARLRTLDVTVRFIRPDVAVVHVMNEMSGVEDAQGVTAAPHLELSIRVLVKEKGVWRVTAFHNTIVSSPQPAEGSR
jgi:uncharacterized protein (TIGR02246 family)